MVELAKPKAGMIWNPEPPDDKLVLKPEPAAPYGMVIIGLTLREYKSSICWCRTPALRDLSRATIACASEALSPEAAMTASANNTIGSQRIPQQVPRLRPPSARSELRQPGTAGTSTLGQHGVP
jgi:hypothetical protein